MTAATPIDQVVEFLEVCGYRRIKEPLAISGLTFDVPAALVGVDKSTDLILVADTAFQKDETILRLVLGVARALDVARSRRPLTTVIVGPPPNATDLEAMAAVSRILPIGQIDGRKAEKTLTKWLAVLAPLQLPQPGGDIADPIAELEFELESYYDEIAELKDMAFKGSKVIKQKLNLMIEEILEDAWEIEE